MNNYRIFLNTYRIIWELVVIGVDNMGIENNIRRVKTGIDGLDEIIEGGLTKNTVTLISGPPGSGKTIFCNQFLYKGLEEGDTCLFLTLDKKVDSIIDQAKRIGLDFQPAIEKGQIKFLFLNINKKLVYDDMTKELASGEYNRVVLDSITPLSERPIYIKDIDLRNDGNFIDSADFPSDDAASPVRLHLHYIMNVLDMAKCTSVITSELPMGSFNLSRDGISEFLVDGIILLNLDSVMDRRKLSVMKMRSTKHSFKSQDIKIGEGGIQLM